MGRMVLLRRTRFRGRELKGSAAALTGAAEALDAAAVKLGGEGVLGATGGAAAKAAGLGMLATGGLVGLAALGVGSALKTVYDSRIDPNHERDLTRLDGGTVIGPDGTVFQAADAPAPAPRTLPSTVKPLGPDYAMPWPEKMYPASSFPSSGGGGGSTQVEVSGQAHQETTVTVNAGSALLSIVDSVKHLMSEIPLLGHATGRMDSDAAPQRGGGIGHN